MIRIATLLLLLILDLELEIYLQKLMGELHELAIDIEKKDLKNKIKINNSNNNNLLYFSQSFA
jgi:hypothetical protein